MPNATAAPVGARPRERDGVRTCRSMSTLARLTSSSNQALSRASTERFRGSDIGERLAKPGEAGPKLRLDGVWTRAQRLRDLGDRQTDHVVKDNRRARPWWQRSKGFPHGDGFLGPVVRGLELADIRIDPNEPSQPPPDPECFSRLDGEQPGSERLRISELVTASQGKLDRGLYEVLGFRLVQGYRPGRRQEDRLQSRDLLGQRFGSGPTTFGLDIVRRSGNGPTSHELRHWRDGDIDHTLQEALDVPNG